MKSGRQTMRSRLLIPLNHHGGLVLRLDDCGGLFAGDDARQDRGGLGVGGNLSGARLRHLTGRIIGLGRGFPDERFIGAQHHGGLVRSG